MKISENKTVERKGDRLVITDTFTGQVVEFAPSERWRMIAASAVLWSGDLPPSEEQGEALLREWQAWSGTVSAPLPAQLDVRTSYFLEMRAIMAQERDAAEAEVTA